MMTTVMMMMMMRVASAMVSAMIIISSTRWQSSAGVTMTRMVRRMWKCKSFEGMVDGRPLAHNGEPSESSVANTRTASRRGIPERRRGGAIALPVLLCSIPGCGREREKCL